MEFLAAFDVDGSPGAQIEIPLTAPDLRSSASHYARDYARRTSHRTGVFSCEKEEQPL